MLSLIVSLIVAGVAGWLAGNIMKAQPLQIGGSPIIGNVLLGLVGGIVGRAMLWVIGFGASGLIGGLIAAVLGAIVVIYVVDYLQKKCPPARAGRTGPPARAQLTFWSLLVVVTTGVGVASSSFRPALKLLMPLAPSPITRGILPAPNRMTTISRTMIQCHALVKPIDTLRNSPPVSSATAPPCQQRTDGSTGTYLRTIPSALPLTRVATSASTAASMGPPGAAR